MTTFSEDLIKRMETLKEVYVGCGKLVGTKTGNYESSETDEFVFSEECIELLGRSDNKIDDNLQYSMYPSLDQYD